MLETKCYKTTHQDLFCGTEGVKSLIKDTSAFRLASKLEQSRVKLQAIRALTMESSLKKLQNHEKSLAWAEVEASAKLLKETLEPYRELQNNIYSLSKVYMASDLVKSMSNIKYDLAGASKLVKTYSEIYQITDFKEYVYSSKIFERSYKPLFELKSVLQKNKEAITTWEGLSKFIILQDNKKDEEIFIQMVNEIYDKYYQEETTEDGFKTNKEIHDAVVEQVKDPVGFQEKVYNLNEKMIRQLFIAYMIFHFLWSNFVQPYFQEHVGVPVTAWTMAHVKELPEKAGEFIGDLKGDIEATIIENVPYYYKVSFVDEKGIKREGYVSKRSVKLIEDDVEEKESNHNHKQRR